jgi:hypothetical protein
MGCVKQDAKRLARRPETPIPESRAFALPPCAKTKRFQQTDQAFWKPALQPGKRIIRMGVARLKFAKPLYRTGFEVIRARRWFFLSWHQRVARSARAMLAAKPSSDRPGYRFQRAEVALPNMLPSMRGPLIGRAPNGRVSGAASISACPSRKST